MNSIIQPESFSEFWGIWLFYVLCSGLISHFIVFVFGALLVALVSTIRRQAAMLKERIAKFAVFLAMLLPVSGFFNALWNCSVWGYRYVTFGSDSENDFSPFLPINQIDIDSDHGKLLIGSIHELQLVWLLFAAIAWGITFILYRLVRPTITKLILRQAQDDGKLETKHSVNSVCLP